MSTPTHRRAFLASALGLGGLATVGLSAQTRGAAQIGRAHV